MVSKDGIWVDSSEGDGGVWERAAGEFVGWKFWVLEACGVGVMALEFICVGVSVEAGIVPLAQADKAISVEIITTPRKFIFLLRDGESAKYR